MDERLRDQAVQLLQQLIRFDTVNPPGAERACQEHLAAHMSAAGFDCELLGRTHERPNLVARLDGEAPGPTLCLLSHVDTVLANPAEWSRDPWSGDLDDDGFVWGRGALDMKSQTAAEAAAACALARSGWRPPRGTLALVALADEETGGSEGARWITANHPDKVRCDYLVNEGGGGILEYDGRRLYCLGCAEKGVFRFALHTDGLAAHASMPRLGDNALLKLAPLLAALGARQPSYRLTDEPRAFLEAIGVLDEDGDAAAALVRVREREPRLVALLEPMLGVSLAPTRAFASEKINVIPSQARIAVDCRVPAGLGEDAALDAVGEVLGEQRDYRLEWTEQVTGNRSPIDSPMADFIRGWIAREDPDALTVPVVLPGFTDSRTFRDAFPECQAYGFFPHRVRTRFETDPLIHGPDERIDVRDLEFAARFYRDLAMGLLAG